MSNQSIISMIVVLIHLYSPFSIQICSNVLYNNLWGSLASLHRCTVLEFFKGIFAGALDLGLFGKKARSHNQELCSPCSLISPATGTEKMQETGSRVFSPHPKGLECLTIGRCHNKSSTLSSAIYNPMCWSSLGLQPLTSSMAVQQKSQQHNSSKNLLILKFALDPSPAELYQTNEYHEVLGHFRLESCHWVRQRHFFVLCSRCRSITGRTPIKNISLMKRTKYKC